MNVVLTALLQIRIEARPACLNLFFRFTAIQEVELWRHRRGPVCSWVDYVCRQVTRTGQNGFEEPARYVPGLRLFVTQDKKTVRAGRKPALDDKEIAERRFIRAFEHRACGKLRPFVGMAKHVERHQSLGARALNRAGKGKAGAVSCRRRSLAEHHDGRSEEQ